MISDGHYLTALNFNFVNFTGLNFVLPLLNFGEIVFIITGANFVAVILIVLILGADPREIFLGAIPRYAFFVVPPTALISAFKDFACCAVIFSSSSHSSTTALVKMPFPTRSSHVAFLSLAFFIS